MNGEAKVVVIGSSGAGKTSITLRLTRGKFTDTVGSTIGASFLKHIITLNDGSVVELQLWDTAGQERFKALAPMYYRGAKIVLIVFDITTNNALEGVRESYQELTEADSQSKVVGIVGNKIDLASKRVISREEGEQLAAELGGLYFETSAKQGTGIQDMFVSLTRKAATMNLISTDENLMPSIEYAPNSKQSGQCC